MCVCERGRVGERERAKKRARGRPGLINHKNMPRVYCDSYLNRTHAERQERAAHVSVCMSECVCFVCACVCVLRNSHAEVKLTTRLYPNLFLRMSRTNMRKPTFLLMEPTYCKHTHTHCMWGARPAYIDIPTGKTELSEVQQLCTEAICNIDFLYRPL